MVVLLLQNNKNFVVPYVLEKLKRVFNRHHLPVHFKPGKIETEVGAPKSQNMQAKTDKGCAGGPGQRGRRRPAPRRNKNFFFSHV